MKLKINELEENVRVKRLEAVDAESAFDAALREATKVCAELEPLRCGKVTFQVFSGWVEILDGGRVVAAIRLTSAPSLAVWLNGLMEALKAAGLTTEE